MTPYSSGIGCKSRVFAATGGTQIGLCGGDAATSAGAQKISGFLHTITVSADTATETISIFDGNSTSGTLLAQIILGATPVPQTFILDLQADVGLFIVVAGSGSPSVTVTYA